MFFFSFARLLHNRHPEVMERKVLERTNSAKASFVPAISCCRSRLSLGNRLLIHAAACAASARKEKRLDCE